MTSKLQQYLAESTKTYPFKIGVAGDLPEGFADHLESALEKFVVVKMSNGKKTPIQQRPLDFPALENERTTYFDTELQYPTTPQVLQQFIKTYCNMPEEQKTVGNSRVMDLLKELEKARKERNAPDAAGEIKAPKDGGATENAGDSKNTMSPISGKSKGK